MQAQDNSPSFEVEAAWRLLLLNWIMIAGMGAALVLGLMLTDFSIGLSGLAVAACYVGLYAGFAHANARSPNRRDPQVIFVLAGIAQTVVITALMTPLTYIAASIDWPLQDANLLAIDRMLQLDWAAYVRFVDAHPTLAAWLSYGYTMIRWPIFAVPVILAAKHHYRPRDPAIATKYANSFAKVTLFSIDQVFGGWAVAQKTHFADGGVFDQIYKPGAR